MQSCPLITVSQVFLPGELYFFQKSNIFKISCNSLYVKSGHRKEKTYLKTGHRKENCISNMVTGNKIVSQIWSPEKKMISQIWSPENNNFYFSIGKRPVCSWYRQPAAMLTTFKCSLKVFLIFQIRLEKNLARLMCLPVQGCLW